MKSSSFIIIILAIGLFYTFSSPQYQEVKKLQASANQYRNVIENASRIAETRDVLLAEYQAIASLERERLVKILPDNVDAVRLALDLDTIANRYGIKITNVAVDTKGDPNAALAVLPEHALQYDKATVTFRFIANYENFIRMLSDLERSLRIMDIRSVSFQVPETGFYEHEMKVDTYWIK